MAPILMAGLSLLPKLPKLWNKVARIFNKKVPSSISDAITLASEVKTVIKSGQITPDQQIALEQTMAEHEEEMAKIALENNKLFYGELEGIRQLEIAAYNSGDQYVARTRPKLLRAWSNYAIIYAFYVPLVVFAAHSLDVDTNLILSVVKWIGSFVFGTFSTAFLGYTTARTIDKRNPNFKESDNILGKVVKNILINKN